MRFLVKATLPVDAGNALVRDPNFGGQIQDIMDDIRPEALSTSLSRTGSELSTPSST